MNVKANTDSSETAEITLGVRGVVGGQCAKFDDDDFNGFRGIACKGHTHTNTHRSRLGLS